MTAETSHTFDQLQPSHTGSKIVWWRGKGKSMRKTQSQQNNLSEQEATESPCWTQWQSVWRRDYKNSLFVPVDKTTGIPCWTQWTKRQKFPVEPSGQNDRNSLLSPVDKMTGIPCWAQWTKWQEFPVEPSGQNDRNSLLSPVEERQQEFPVEPSGQNDRNSLLSPVEERQQEFPVETSGGEATGIAYWNQWRRGNRNCLWNPVEER